jgi:hypothetical protein
MASLAEMERELTVERTRAGLAVARLSGRKGGRKPKMTKSKIESAKKLLASGIAPRTWPRTSVSIPTLYRWVPASGHAEQNELRRRTKMSTNHSHALPSERNEKSLWIALALTGSFLLAEVAAGIVFNSLALLSDAAHMFTDAAALAIALAAVRVARRPADAKHLWLLPLRNPCGRIQRPVALRRRWLHPV